MASINRMEPRDESTPRPAGPSRRTVLASTAAAALALPLLRPSLAAAAPDSGQGPADGPGGPNRPQRPEPELRRLMGEMDPARVEATITRLVAFGTRNTLSAQDDPARGIGAARDWILAELQAVAATSGGRMTVTTQSFTQTAGLPVPTTITNVVATLRGTTSPERVYVVTGHYDSRNTDVFDPTGDAPGADDDGSGVAVVLELARVFARRPIEATIMFAAVAGEEQGLFGSAFLAQQIKAAGTDVEAMFSNDIVGASQAFDGTRPDPHTVRLFVEGVPTAETAQQAAIRQAVGGEDDGPSRQLARFVSSVADNDDTGMRVRVVWRRDRFLRASDHVSFLQQGYPAGRFTEPRENFDHEHQNVRVENGVQFGDLLEFVDFDYATRVGRVNAATLWSLAQGPGTPKNVVIVATSLTNLSTLHWTRGSEPDLAGYEVVWRETTAPDWTNVIPVGDVTSVTVDLVKDNVHIGLRAVDRNGHRSPVAYPRPGA